MLRYRSALGVPGLPNNFSVEDVKPQWRHGLKLLFAPGVYANELITGEPPTSGVYTPIGTPLGLAFEHQQSNTWNLAWDDSVFTVPSPNTSLGYNLLWVGLPVTRNSYNTLASIRKGSGNFNSWSVSYDGYLTGGNSSATPDQYAIAVNNYHNLSATGGRGRSSRVNLGADPEQPIAIAGGHRYQEGMRAAVGTRSGMTDETMSTAIVSYDVAMSIEIGGLADYTAFDATQGGYTLLFAYWEQPFNDEDLVTLSGDAAEVLDNFLVPPRMYPAWGYNAGGTITTSNISLKTMTLATPDPTALRSLISNIPVV